MDTREHEGMGGTTPSPEGFSASALGAVLGALRGTPSFRYAQTVAGRSDGAVSFEASEEEATRTLRMPGKVAMIVREEMRGAPPGTGLVDLEVEMPLGHAVMQVASANGNVLAGEGIGMAMIRGGAAPAPDFSVGTTTSAGLDVRTVVSWDSTRGELEIASERGHDDHRIGMRRSYGLGADGSIVTRELPLGPQDEALALSLRNEEAAQATAMPDRDSRTLVSNLVDALRDVPDFAFTTDGHGGKPGHPVTGNADLGALTGVIEGGSRPGPSGPVFHGTLSVGDAVLQVANGAGRMLTESNAANGGADRWNDDHPEDFTVLGAVRADEDLAVTVRWDRGAGRLMTAARTQDHDGNAIGIDRGWSIDGRTGALVRETTRSVAGTIDDGSGHVPSGFDRVGRPHRSSSPDPVREVGALMGRLAVAATDRDTRGLSEDGKRVAVLVRREDVVGALEAGVDPTGARGTGYAATLREVSGLVRQPRYGVVDGKSVVAEGHDEGRAGIEALSSGFGDRSFARRLWLDADGLRRHAATEDGLTGLGMLVGHAEKRSTELTEDRAARIAARRAAQPGRSAARVDLGSRD